MTEEPTTPDLVERVRALMDAGGRADWDTAIHFFAPDAVWVGIPGVGDTTYQGKAIRDFWVEWYAPYEDVQIELVEVVYLGGDVVMAVIRQSGRLGDAPSRVREEIALVYEWSDGLIERVTTYTDLDQARAAAERLAEERGEAVLQENVEVVRGMYEAFNRGEIDRSREELHPAAELHQSPRIADTDSYYGRDEFVRGLALWLREWEEPQFEPLDVREAGNGVVMRVRVSGKGRASGIETALEFFHAWTLLDGKPYRCFVRSTEAEALKTVGLED